MRGSSPRSIPVWVTLIDLIAVALLALGVAVVIWNPGWRPVVVGIRISLKSGWRVLAVAAILAALRHAAFRRPTLPGRLIGAITAPARAIRRSILANAIWTPGRPGLSATQYLLAPLHWVRPLTRWLDRIGLAVFAVVLVWLGVLLTICARARPFWHDEIFTILTSAFPVATLWRATLDGLDLSPPLNTMLTHLLRPLTGVGPIVTRLPAMAGFFAATVLVFVMVRRRANALIGLAAVFGLCMTSAWQYALEARGYGLTLGLFATALYGWSEAAAGRRPVLHWTVMAASVAAGIWTHYYFVVAILPIVAGEVVRQIGIRRVHWAPWMAFAGAALASLPLWPLASAAAGQRGTFWARLRILEFAPTYRYVTARYEFPLVAFGLLAALAAIELARRTHARQWPRQLPAHEAAAGLACLALPAAAVMLGFWIGTFDLRYAVFGAVGLALALPLLVWVLAPENGLGDLILAITLAASFVGFSQRTFDEPSPRAHPYAERPLLADWLERGDPIVITGGVDYLPLWYYAPEASRPRALYLADLDGQLRDMGADTSDRGYLALARWTPVSVVPISDFVRTHPHFWLYSSGTTWVERTLGSLGATMTERVAEPSGVGRFFEVVIPEP